MCTQRCTHLISRLQKGTYDVSKTGVSTQCDDDLREGPKPMLNYGSESPNLFSDSHAASLGPPSSLPPSLPSSLFPFLPPYPFHIY